MTWERCSWWSYLSLWYCSINCEDIEKNLIKLNCLHECSLCTCISQRFRLYLCIEKLNLKCCKMYNLMSFKKKLHENFLDYTTGACLHSKMRNNSANNSIHAMCVHHIFLWCKTNFDFQQGSSERISGHTVVCKLSICSYFTFTRSRQKVYATKSIHFFLHFLA